MNEVAEYRRYAEICKEISRDVISPIAKRHLLEMSAVCVILAGEREQELMATRSDP